MEVMKGLPPVSKSGFLLGAGLALAAAAVKIVFLHEMDERHEAKGAGDAALTLEREGVAGRV